MAQKIACTSCASFEIKLALNSIKTIILVGDVVCVASLRYILNYNEILEIMILHCVWNPNISLNCNEITKEPLNFHNSKDDYYIKSAQFSIIKFSICYYTTYCYALRLIIVHINFGRYDFVVTRKSYDKSAPNAIILTQSKAYCFCIQFRFAL